jgi:hypothetical protein
MPYGSGPVIRHALIVARPWQRYVVCTAMMLGGVALAALGHVAGVVLAAAGAVLLYRMRRGRAGGSPGERDRVGPTR